MRRNKNLTEYNEYDILGRKQQTLTKPINNTGFGLNRGVCVFLRSPQNLWDFALDRKK